MCRALHTISVYLRLRLWSGITLSERAGTRYDPSTCLASACLLLHSAPYWLHSTGAYSPCASAVDFQQKLSGHTWRYTTLPCDWLGRFTHRNVRVTTRGLACASHVPCITLHICMPCAVLLARSMCHALLAWARLSLLRLRRCILACDRLCAMFDVTRCVNLSRYSRR